MTLVAIASKRGREQAGQTAFVRLDDRAQEIARLTYGDLHHRAQAIARALLAEVNPGDRALMIYETGTDFIAALFGAFYAGVVAVPIPAPEPGRLQRSLPRLEAVSKDAGAKLLLGSASTLEVLRDIGAQELRSGPSRWIDTTAIPQEKNGDGGGDGLPEIEPHNLAYLQYTSGSTSQPKGVMISHHNLMVNLEAIRRGMGYDPDSVSVCWMPHFHDYGLIEGHLEPLFNGTPAYLLSPYDFVKRPICWLEAISTYRVTHTQGPNFAYAHCLRRTKEAQRQGLDLKSLRASGNAAEPINPKTLVQFVDTFAPYGFRETSMATAYGLAEVTLIASTTRPQEPSVLGWFDAEALGGHRAVPVAKDTPGSRCVAGCGHALPGVEIAIVDPDTHERRPPDGVGEVWLASESVSAGYWQLPEESVETFQARIAGEGETAYLRTGDLGFMQDDELYIVSRLKDLIIVRGLNHHPQDIEWTVQAVDPALRPGNGAAFSIDVDGDERLVLVQELDGANPTLESCRDILDRIAEAVLSRHEIGVHQAVLIEKGSLFKTSSGKVQRRAMRDAFLNNTLHAIATWNHGEVTLNTDPNQAAPNSAAAADALNTWLRTYAEERINSRLIDERRGVPPSIILDFGNRGLFGLQVPRKYGGLELTHRDTYRVLQQLGAIDLSLATLVFLHNTNGIFPILWFGSESKKKELVPLLASGRELGAFALSEPEAGSNLGGLSTRAQPQGEGWTITGTKRWNGSAWAGVTSVFARMVDASGRLGGLTAFVVRQSDPGVRVGHESLTMGVRGIMQNALHFEGVRVSKESLLGEPGKGMRVAVAVLSASRLTTAAVALGGAQRCAQLMLRYTTRRKIETGTLIDNPQTLARMSELTHRTALGLELLDRCAAVLDGSRSLPPELAMAVKVLATDTLNFGADLLVQLLGGRGYMENNIAPQLFRDARMLSIGEGPNEGLVAAIGRWVRLEVGIGDIEEGFSDQEALETLEGLKARIQAAFETGGPVSKEDRIRQDVWLGRAVLITLNLLAARALSRQMDGGHQETLAWAKASQEAFLRELDGWDPSQENELARADLVVRIRSYREAIGDVEPLAPDADNSLDPLLRREADPTLEEKRALLRKLLESEQEEGTGRD